MHFIRSDLEFILQQILIGEANSNAYGGTATPLTELLPNSRVAFGLRTVDGTFNNLLPGQTGFGASDQPFPLQLDQVFRNEADGDFFDPDGPLGPAPAVVTNNNYASTVSVADADPRLISNLIVDQTITNPAAVQAFVDAGFGVVDAAGVLHYLNDDGTPGAVVPPLTTLTLPNATPDAALSAGFNSWFTFFGQFFDHGLDLVDKGNNGTVYIPLMPDDPLYDPTPGATTNFMVLTRATNSLVAPGTDGVLGTADDVHLHNNETTPFIDQNQTYTSHASHQVFLREYVLDDNGDPHATGRLIDGANGGIGNWAEVKAQAATMLGIQLTDFDIHNVPLLATDLYGKFIPGSNGYAQFVTTSGLIEANPDDNNNTGTLAPANVLRSGHAFLNDIAHHAAPGSFDTNGPAPGGDILPQTADLDAGPEGLFGDDLDPTTYDNELLDAHMITGDGRGNENIGLTSVHFIFHAEHNRLAEHIKDVAIASNDATFASQWLLDDDTDPNTLAISQVELNAINAITNPAAKAAAIDALNWNGERIFQAARFGTEMQYQHLVFEEFGRKISPGIDLFFAPTQVYDTAINPAIVAEFAHVVYRFGHSLLPDTVDRFDANFDLVNGTEQIGLIEAFLNPLEFTASGVDDIDAAGNIIRGVTRQIGNEIDELVTEAVRNNLLGLPLDLAAINLARGRDTGVPPLNQARAEFYAMTGDSQLKPYTSWADFGANLKHSLALVNFVAAYGTHVSITLADTLIEKRAAAYALVYGEGGIDGIVLDDPSTPVNEAADNATVAVPADRLDFLFSTGTWANSTARPKDVDQVTNTGLGNVDLWVGGLAEKQMPFGGLLGSTFNFVFETQMEKLQDGDRFYYLERTQGMNFLTELENNSFAKLMMANTDVTHLPGDVFTTPAFTLEVNDAVQYTGLGPDGRDDPTEGGTALNPLVLRNNPNTTAPDPFYVEYNGEDHVVLGGTANADTIISSIGDDTLYGDDGDDRLDGGDGVDMVFGGAGDDIITDLGGDDLIRGQDGNDAIHGGNGINLILAGFGNDFVVTGEDASESFGGFGNDFILGVRANEFVFGNEGDDWIQVGMVDGAAGDNFDAFGRDLIRGNDVFIGEGLTDRMDGEGGDDIMVGNGGEGDRYEGLSGFDWAVFKDAPAGATADLTLRAFDETPVPRTEALLARFTSVEGLSGSAHGDFLRGDMNTATEIAVSGAYGSVLENIALINGLQAFLNDLTPGNGNVPSFGAGNIILGGAGSDLIEGRGGDDLIDGDLWLNVRIGGVDKNGVSIGANINSMEDIQARVFAGEVRPGDLFIVREILDGTPGAVTDFDTALFSGALANYTIATVGGVTTVTDTTGVDGVDTVRNIERLQFTDQAVVLGGLNQGPAGLLTINDTTPTENQVLTVSGFFDNPLTAANERTVTDANNPGGQISEPITYFWQQEVRPGVWEDIIIENEAPEAVRATGLTFTPGDLQVGNALRVRAVYKDANGVLETAFSAATALVAGVNDAPVGSLLISDPTPTETQALVGIAQFTDADGMTAPGFTYQWQQSALGGGGAFTNIAGATVQTFTPGAAQVNRALRLVTTYVDDQGFTNTVTSAATAVTGDFINDGAGGNTSNGNAGQDIINGNGGGDTINGNGGNDLLNGGAGGDTINGGAGNDAITGGAGGDTLAGGTGDDTFNYTIGDGADAVTGGANGVDKLNITGTAGNDSLDVVFNGTVLTQFENGTIGGVERVTADLLGNAGAGDTLNYTGTNAAVVVNLAAATASGFTAIAASVATQAVAAIAGIENVTGGGGNDTLTGDDSANALTGAGGNDTLNGGGGDDTANGGAGNDALNGGGGNDTANGGGGNDTLNGGAGIDTLNGDGGVDTLDGGDGNDVLNGGAANDRLIGGAGNDILIGDAGNDDFVLTPGFGADTAIGFDANPGGGGQDRIDVTGLGINATNFAARVLIEDLGADTRVTIDGVDTITFNGVNGVGANVITQADFLLAPNALLGLNAFGGNADLLIL